jgi:hypothetical protein
VAAADEVNHLQRSRDPEGDLFNMVAEKGHYAGKTYPTDTRQGTYAFTPSGIFLASVNSGNPEDIAAMLTKALNKWNTLSREERLMDRDPASLTAMVKRNESKYPSDGLVLHMYSRDLERSNPPRDWRADAWNQDFAWYRRDEARRWVPSELKVGAEGAVPDDLARRLAAAHLIDNVRGQVPPFEPDQVQSVNIQSKIVGKEGKRWVVWFEGRSAASASGKWPVQGSNDANSPRVQTRGVKTKILGRGIYDAEASRFTKFDLAAVGTRWGASQYNGRHDDMESAPIGFFFTLAGDTPEEQIPPANLWIYRW